MARLEFKQAMRLREKLHEQYPVRVTQAVCLDTDLLIQEICDQANTWTEPAREIVVDLLLQVERNGDN